MKKCTLQNPDDITNVRYNALHTGLYEDRSYDAMSAFLLLYNRKDYEINLTFRCFSIDKELFLKDFPGNDGTRLFYNVFVSPNGELVIDCRNEPNLKEKLFNAIVNTALALRRLCEINRIDSSKDYFTVYASEDLRMFTFNASTLEVLARSIDEEHDSGKPNDVIIAERNRLMQKEFWSLRSRLFDIEAKIYAHKLFNRADKYKDFKFNPDMVMKPLKVIDGKLHDDIEKYLNEVEKRNTLIESPNYVTNILFSRFK